MDYRMWDLYELTILDIWSTKTISNLERTRFIITSFQVVENYDK